MIKAIEPGYIGLSIALMFAKSVEIIGSRFKLVNLLQKESKLSKIISLEELFKNAR